MLMVTDSTGSCVQHVPQRRRCGTIWPRIDRSRATFRQAEVPSLPQAVRPPVHASRLSAAAERRQSASSSDRQQRCRARGSAAFFAPFFGRASSSWAFLLVGALEEDAGLERLLDEIRVPALRALLRNGLVVRREVALGVVGATPEDIAATRLALRNVALRRTWGTSCLQSDSASRTCTSDSQSTTQTRRRRPAAAPAACRRAGHVFAR